MGKTSPAVDAIALRVNKTIAQVLLRWGVQHGLIVLPKSSNPERIRENIAGLFEWSLSETDMAALDVLTTDDSLKEWSQHYIERKTGV
jgi:diketogulonate reductase-like aldo/keto reductase